MSDHAQADPADNTPLSATQTDETSPPDVVEPDSQNTDPESDSEPESDSFPRSYVERLRRESAGYREKATQAERQAQEADSYADGFAQRLHAELVRATGKLADPSDLPFTAEHLMDESALLAAIENLLAEKPHLRSRKVSGDVGQGFRGPAAEFSLLDALKSRA